MKTWLYLAAEGLLDSSPNWTCCWWRNDEIPNVMPLAQAAAELAGCNIVLVLPMETCSWWLTDKWPSRRHPSTQALAYAIEDQLGQELDNLHIATGRVDGSRRYPVMVIEQQQLEMLLTLLKSLGIEPTSLHVDADLLPNNQPCGAWWFGRWIIGGAMDARLALTEETRQTLSENVATPLHWLNDPSSSLSVISSMLSKNSRQAIDLRQGTFLQLQRRWPWRIVVAALGVAFLLAWGFTQARSQYLEQEAGRLYAQSVQRFKSMYPEQTRIIDLSTQLKAQQSRGRVSGITQLARLRSLVEQVIGNSSVEVQRIEYRAGGYYLQPGKLSLLH